MTGETGEYIRMGVSMKFISAFVAAIVTVLVMGISSLNSFTDKVNTSVAESNSGALADITNVSEVSFPTCYSVINNNIAIVESVTIRYANGSSTCHYHVDGSVKDTLLKLTTGMNTTRKGSVTTKQSVKYPSMFTVVITEVD